MLMKALLATGVPPAFGEGVLQSSEATYASIACQELTREAFELGERLGPRHPSALGAFMESRYCVAQNLGLREARQLQMCRLRGEECPREEQAVVTRVARELDAHEAAVRFSAGERKAFVRCGPWVRESEYQAAKLACLAAHACPALEGDQAMLCLGDYVGRQVWRDPVERRERIEF